MPTVTSKDGTKIAYDAEGHGPALILVDGALCYRDFGPARPLAKLLTPHFTVYTYDRRGRGESGNTLPYAVEREIEDIEALLNTAGGSVYVYGISSGAALAADAAACLPIIRKLALYEAPFIVDDTNEPRPDDYIDRMDALIASDRRGAALKMFMRTVGTPAFFLMIMPLMPMWPKLKRVAHTLPYDLRVLGDTGAGRPLSSSRWKSATMPALVMDGGSSPTFMRNSQRAFADVLPNAQHRTLEGQTHLLKPEAVAPVLIEFFTD
jgi:pimeloyl-ACP methyl ester carboxylesterase